MQELKFPHKRYIDYLEKGATQFNNDTVVKRFFSKDGKAVVDKFISKDGTITTVAQEYLIGQDGKPAWFKTFQSANTIRQGAGNDSFLSVANNYKKGTSQTFACLKENNGISTCLFRNGQTKGTFMHILDGVKKTTQVQKYPFGATFLNSQNFFQFVSDFCKKFGKF